MHYFSLNKHSNVFGGRSNRAPCGWELGTRTIEPTDAFRRLYGDCVPPQTQLNLFELHADQVGCIFIFYAKSNFL